MRVRWLLPATLILALVTSAAGVAAEEDPLATDFTASTRVTAVLDPGTFEFGDDGVIRYRGLVEAGVVTEPSDPRFSGTFTWTGNRDQYSDPISFYVWHGSYRIENEDGAWQETPSVWLHRGGNDPRPATLVFVGEEAYEGLTAVAEVMPLGGMDLDGVIFTGEIPPPPAE